MTPFYSEKIYNLKGRASHSIVKKMHSVATGYAWGVIATDCLAHLHPGKAQGDGFGGKMDYEWQFLITM